MYKTYLAWFKVEESTFLSGPFWLAGTIGVEDKAGGDGWISSGLLIACGYDNITITLYYQLTFHALVVHFSSGLQLTEDSTLQHHRSRAVAHLR